MICTVIKCDRCGDEWNITKAGFTEMTQFWKDYEKKNEYEVRTMKERDDGKLHSIPTKEIEGFEECLGKKCPLYYEDVTRPRCYRVDREKTFNG